MEAPVFTSERKVRSSVLQFSVFARTIVLPRFQNHSRSSNVVGRGTYADIGLLAIQVNLPGWPRRGDCMQKEQPRLRTRLPCFMPDNRSRACQGNKDTPHMSAERRSEHVEHSTFIKNERRDVDKAVRPIVPASGDSTGRNAAPAEKRRSQVWHAIPAVVRSVVQYCRLCATSLLTLFGIADWPKRPYIALGSETKNRPVVRELQRKPAAQQEAVLRGPRGQVLSSVASGPFHASQPKGSNTGETLPQSSAHTTGSVNFVSSNSLTELDLQAFQDRLSSGSDHHLVNSRTPPRSLSERASVIRLNVGKKPDWLPDLDVYAIGSDEADVVHFVAKLDTGACFSVLAEKVAARFGLDQIDRGDRPDIAVMAEKGVKAIGRLDIEFRQASNMQWYGESFYVIPDTVIQDRFDALLSRNVIGQMNLLLLGPTLTGQSVPTELL